MVIETFVFGVQNGINKLWRHILYRNRYKSALAKLAYQLAAAGINAQRRLQFNVAKSLRFGDLRV